MQKEQFDNIFDKTIIGFINEVKDNNSLLEINDLSKSKARIYNDYNELMAQYKEHIFPSPDNCLLDRHRIASCICGAFLKNQIFNTEKMEAEAKSNRTSFEAIFYYANELAAFHASCRYLSIFMLDDKKQNRPLCYDIYNNFPNLPRIMQIKKGFLNCVLFNLRQISDIKQIGLKHYDLYAYAMFFFHLEQTFYQNRKTGE